MIYTIMMTNAIIPLRCQASHKPCSSGPPARPRPPRIAPIDLLAAF
jgi:hypothetical protein